MCSQFVNCLAASAVSRMVDRVHLLLQPAWPLAVAASTPATRRETPGSPRLAILLSIPRPNIWSRALAPEPTPGGTAVLHQASRGCGLRPARMRGKCLPNAISEIRRLPSRPAEASAHQKRRANATRWQDVYGADRVARKSG